MVEIKPIGEFILAQKEVQPLITANGYYYHYTDVVSMLAKYRKQSAAPDAGKEEQQDESVQEFDEVENPDEVKFGKSLSILKNLVLLKELKDRDGKTEYYLLNQPYAWDMAKEFLKKHQK